jgi:hypothetical protein
MTDASAKQPVLVIMGVAGCAVAARPAEIIRRLGLRAVPFSSAFAMRQC